MKTTEMEARPCPQCGAPNNRATSMGSDDAPSPGDVSLCVGCGTILVFADDLSSRKPTTDEEVEILLAMPAEFRAAFLEMQAILQATAPSRPSPTPSPDRSNDPSEDQT